MNLIRWENNLQLPENILSNRFNSRQHDMHKTYAEQKVGGTDALNTSPSHLAQQIDTLVSSAQNLTKRCICIHRQP